MHLVNLNTIFFWIFPVDICSVAFPVVKGDRGCRAGCFCSSCVCFQLNESATGNVTPSLMAAFLSVNSNCRAQALFSRKTVYHPPSIGSHLMAFLLVPCYMCARGLTRHADFVSKEAQCSHAERSFDPKGRYCVASSHELFIFFCSFGCSSRIAGRSF